MSDAAVGGTVNNLCPGDENFIWNTWGNLNFGSAPDLNIQNQGDVADWPCYAKYYVTFPLSQIPPGKAILSASLILHQWGNNGPSNLAKSSLIHVLSVAEDWDETALTWNSAPLAYENLAQLVVPPIDCTNGGGQMHWPCTPPRMGCERRCSFCLCAWNPVTSGRVFLRFRLSQRQAVQHI